MGLTSSQLRDDFEGVSGYSNAAQTPDELFPGVLDEVRLDFTQAQTTQSVGFWYQSAHGQGLLAENSSFPTPSHANELLWPEQTEQNEPETAGASNLPYAHNYTKPSIE